MLKLRTFCAGKSQLLHHTKLLTQSVIERVPALCLTGQVLTLNDQINLLFILTLCVYIHIATLHKYSLIHIS